MISSADSNAKFLPDLSGYSIIEQIYAGSKTAVYRALQGEQQRPVIIKVLKLAYPSFNDLVQFRNQYTITKNLAINGIAQPLSLEAWENSYALIMEDSQSISLAQYALSQPIEIASALKIGVQMADILHHLHKNRIIHKDIKPANILIHPETQKIELIDFSIASLLPKETQEIRNPNALEGTLAYIAPEQTGRMNRGIDYRGDFYSLGVTLYKLLTGNLPFQCEDPLELVHSHIAKTPTRPHQINPTIPPVLSAIILKLMAKNAEDRYQSALGLKYDLEKCLTQWEQQGNISEFDLGQRDICDRFLIPEKLYGRTLEVETLLNAFERVANCSSEMMLVAGFSGVGKTALINEVHKPITRQQGYFIKGKFDQFNRNIPLSAFVLALQDLIGQLLSESDKQLQTWKTQILAAVGESGQVLVEVIPELENIIGEQPNVPELPGNAAQNRFNLVFQKFIQVFATPEHPLVVFLDDLQWADTSSLQLMKQLLDTPYLLLLGAYRDNEVSPVHPFIVTVEELKAAQATVGTITLQPLKIADINQLVSDTFHCPPERSLPLSELIERHTQGNPFFITQFLKALQEEGYVTFNPDQGCWECDLAQINSRYLTDDVVEFMSTQLQKFPPETQNVLKLAACIGNQFDLETLAVICEQTQIETAVALWKALQDGLIVPQTQVYKFYLNQEQAENYPENRETVQYRFLHDRVQQAAYSLIPEDQKARTHFHIGQLLLAKISPEQREDRIFELVNQLNYGIPSLQDGEERDELVKMNLMAARKAKVATAYRAGLEYAKIGISLLGKNAWQEKYQPTLEFHEIAGELAALVADYPTMDTFLKSVLDHAENVLDQAVVYRVRLQVYTITNQLQEALNCGKEYLAKLGIDLPENTSPNDMQQAVGEIYQLIGNRQIEDLLDLPVMSDQRAYLITLIASNMMAAAYLSGSPVFFILTALSIKLSIQYGNAPSSGYAYVSYAFMNCNIFGDIDSGFRFGQLATQLILKLEAKAYEPEVLHLVGLLIIHRKRHLKETLPVLKTAYATALEVGNYELVGYNAQAFCLNAFWSGQPLVNLEKEIRAYCNELVKLNQLISVDWCRIFWQPVLNLMGLSENPRILAGEAFQEKVIVPQLLATKNFYALFNLYSYKLLLGYLFGDLEQARKALVEITPYAVSGTGYITQPVVYFYEALTFLAGMNSQVEAPAEEWNQILKNQTLLQQNWAASAPMNHQHKVDLIEAEKCRVLGQNYEAGDWYDQAIRGAKDNEYIQEEGLANELAAKFYLNWGKEQVAAGYMQQAYYCYAHWGAKAKIAHLEANYPDLLKPILQPASFAITSGLTISANVSKSVSSSNTNSTSSSSQKLWFDFPAIIKAAQTISQVLEIDKLLESLMQIALSNAGAQKGTLLLRQEQEWIIVFQSSQDHSEKLEIPLEKYQALPHSLIYAVARHQQAAVFDDLSAEIQYASDRYVIGCQPKSVICTPLLRQGNLIGILYLENPLTVGAFTKERIEILQILASQAAISLENARLYQTTENYSHILEAEVHRKTQDLNQKAQDLEQTLKKLQQTQAQLIQSEKMSSLGQLVAGIAHEINNPISFIKGNINPIKNYVEDLMNLLKLYINQFPEVTPEIAAKSEEIDLGFILEDLYKILNSMQIGSDRISKIVVSLRGFSRLDESEIKTVDLHSGLENTLLILQSRLQATEDYSEIQVVKNYGNLPNLTCHPSQLNQVFLNIINNAIDAIRENPQASEQPEIRIETKLLNNSQVSITIANTDSTIPESVQQKLFEPFFTTKPVGRGTGLGLFASYSIIQKHQGSLTVKSLPGEGTEFKIILPVR